MIALTSILFCSWCGIVLSFQPKLKFKIEKFTRLYVESLDSKLSIETSIPSNNDNSDNNNIIIDDSNNINSSNNGDGRSSTLPPRVYKSKSQLQPISEARIVSGSALVLVNPQFLIRYRAPKVKSGLKTQLEELQVSLMQRSLLFIKFVLILLYS